MDRSLLENLAGLMIQKGHYFARIYSCIPASKELNMSSAVCLGIINGTEGGCSATELKEMSCYDKALISRMLTDMQNDGYIIRNPEDKDKQRGMRYIPSEKGKILGDMLSAEFLKISSEVSKDIPKEDLKTFYEVSCKLINNLDEYAGELESVKLEKGK
ncbi:MarR family winged helix-turn-helix transcriptional regulator [Ruminococcus albus]|uniref:DNA-binding transcriptional regulator, MarR family n=1 Tax=Ruminococcus albus TaxID=1264 RepID=A0A1H7MDL6_RUMAL|nr:MarR family transcriptional regulator [Ruminococcus albus]SEL09008.1 DNA-binding transcriptional regulator, MarR family [Ruminococcus albus]